jgi:DUF4097 and DUF4098 domain-containing protein YvlB
MRQIPRQGPTLLAWACVAVALLAWAAAPAAAQEPKWADDLGREIEAQVEQHIKLATRQLEHFVDHHLEDILADVLDEVHRAVDTHARKVQVKVQQGAQQQARAQAQREAAEARRAAQRAREAERRRREDTRRGQEYTEPISKTLRLGRNGTFDLQNVSGDITVTGGSGNDVRIEATKRVRHPNESEARALLQAIEVRIEERNGDVEVRTDYPRRNWSGGVDYAITLPREANVILRSISGDIRVSTINGDLRAETVSGDLTATSVRRIRQAKTTSGDLEITDSDGEDVSGASISGSVTARSLKARSIDLQSISGDLRMADVESDRMFVKSISGDIEFSGRMARTGRYEFQTHSGDIRVTPQGASGFSIEASTFSGDLRSDFPLTLQGNPPNRGRGFTGSTIRATVGDGGAVLLLRSFSGGITVIKR